MKTALLLIDLQNDFAPAARWRSRRATPSSRLPIRRSLPVWRVASRSWPAGLALRQSPQLCGEFPCAGRHPRRAGGPAAGVVAGALRAREPRCRFSPRLQRQHINAVFAKGRRRTSTATARSSITATVHRPNCTAGCNRRASSGWQSWAGDRLLRQVQRTGCAGCRLSNAGDRRRLPRRESAAGRQRAGAAGHGARRCATGYPVTISRQLNPLGCHRRPLCATAKISTPLTIPPFFFPNGL